MKYYIVRHSYTRNYKWRTSLCYTTDKAKAEERYAWANDHIGLYDVYMNEWELTDKQVQELLDKIGKDMVELNGFTKEYFIV